MPTSFLDENFNSDTQLDKVLKVTVPKEYTDKQRQEIYKLVKEQVGDFYLPVVVSHGVDLEIIV